MALLLSESFTLWQQATIEITCHDHSSRTFNRSYASNIRDYRVLFFVHIPFVGKRTFNATPMEMLQRRALYEEQEKKSY